MISCQIQMHIHISNAAQNDWFFSQFPDLHQNVLYRKWHELFEAESEYDCIILDLLSKYKTLSFTRIRHLFGHSWIPLLSDFEAKTIQYFVYVLYSNKTHLTYIVELTFDTKLTRKNGFLCMFSYISQCMHDLWVTHGIHGRNENKWMIWCV